jgi:hypothetical protein
VNDYKPLDLLVIGAGMIVNDLLLPSVYQLQRLGVVKDISVCDARISSLQALKENTLIKEAFPEQDFLIRLLSLRCRTSFIIRW